MTAVATSIGRAVEYLLELRHGDGHWEDYELPVGRSDAWVTAAVAVALVEASRALDGTSVGRDALSAARTASAWLRANRQAPCGWGFNAVAGPDADSTAWALRLFSCLGENADDRDAEFLVAKHRSEGGFATYDGPASWGRAHADVTPTVFLALPRKLRAPLVPAVVGYAERVRAPDGTWPSYWWRTCHYATLVNTELYDRLALQDEYALPVVSHSETQGVYTAFDLACVTGVAAIRSRGTTLVEGLVRELLLVQGPRGDWAGGANLRVTDPGCAQPWRNPRGRLYVDHAGLLTTATAVRALVFSLPEVAPA